MATLTDLAEATAFERFALASATPTVRPGYGWVDLRNGGNGGYRIGSANACAEALERQRLEWRPLFFGAAWKILDLVVEYALPPPVRGAWRIDEKAKRAVSQTGVTVWPPFTSQDPEWVATLRMYSETVEFRHGVVHRDIRRDPQTGELEATVRSGPNTGRTLTLSDDEQTAFCRAASRLINAIINGDIEPRDRDDLAFQLAQVHQYSGVAPSSNGSLGPICELHIDLRDAGAGQVELDVAALDAAMQQHRGSFQAFDLVAYLPNAAGAAPLVGKLEDAVLDRPVTQFARSAPPAWLSGTRQQQIVPQAGPVQTPAEPTGYAGPVARPAAPPRTRRLARWPACARAHLRRILARRRGRR